MNKSQKTETELKKLHKEWVIKTRDAQLQYEQKRAEHLVNPTQELFDDMMKSRSEYEYNNRTMRRYTRQLHALWEKRLKKEFQKS